jgi:hypothetical protein
MNNKTIDGALLFAQNAITNAINQPALKPLLEDYGYNDARLSEGEDLYNIAQEAQILQKKEYGEQYEATAELDVAKANTDKEFKRHLKIARIALSDAPGPAMAMQLTGTRKRTLSGWISQVKAFYANALIDQKVLDALAKFNLTSEKLEASKSLVLDCELKYNMQLKEKGEAQAATAARDEAFDALDKWMSDFIGIARIALESHPQYLEMLGIIEP